MDTVRTSTANGNQVGATRKQSLLDVVNSNYHQLSAAADSRERRESGFVEGDFSDYDSSGSRRNSDNFNCSYSSDGHSSPDIFCLDLEDGIKKAVANAAVAATTAAAPNSEAVCKEASKVGQYIQLISLQKRAFPIFTMLFFWALWNIHHLPCF